MWPFLAFEIKRMIDSGCVIVLVDGHKGDEGEQKYRFILAQLGSSTSIKRANYGTDLKSLIEPLIRKRLNWKPEIQTLDLLTQVRTLG